MLNNVLCFALTMILATTGTSAFAQSVGHHRSSHAARHARNARTVRGLKQNLQNSQREERLALQSQQNLQWTELKSQPFATNGERLSAARDLRQQQQAENAALHTQFQQEQQSLKTDLKAATAKTITLPAISTVTSSGTGTATVGVFSTGTPVNPNTGGALGIVDYATGKNTGIPTVAGGGGIVSTITTAGTATNPGASTTPPSGTGAAPSTSSNTTLATPTTPTQTNTPGNATFPANVGVSPGITAVATTFTGVSVTTGSPFGGGTFGSFITTPGALFLNGPTGSQLTPSTTTTSSTITGQ